MTERFPSTFEQLLASDSGEFEREPLLLKSERSRILGLLLPQKSLLQWLSNLNSENEFTRIFLHWIKSFTVFQKLNKFL